MLLMHLLQRTSHRAPVINRTVQCGFWISAFAISEGGAMTRKRTLGTMAALGGLAAFELLTGVPSAKADEVSDLRANNELLQQRLDQIAQMGNNGPSRLGSADVQAMTAAATAGSFPRSFLIPGTDTSVSYTHLRAHETG